jgi:hypothetical protein
MASVSGLEDQVIDKHEIGFPTLGPGKPTWYRVLSLYADGFLSPSSVIQLDPSFA